MAFERFEAGMNGFFDRVEQAKRRETAKTLAAAGERIQSGEDVEAVSTTTIESQRHLGRTLLLIRTMRNGINDMMANLTKQLGSIGVNLPPIEALQERPYTISLVSDSVRGDFKTDGEEVREEIRLKLGDSSAFYIPPDPDDPEKKMTIDELGVTTRTYRSLERERIATIHDLLSRSATDIRKFRNFGPESMDDLLTALQRAGVVPKDQSPTIETSSTIPQEQ